VAPRLASIAGISSTLRCIPSHGCRSPRIRPRGGGFCGSCGRSQGNGRGGLIPPVRHLLSGHELCRFVRIAPGLLASRPGRVAVLVLFKRTHSAWVKRSTFRRDPFSCHIFFQTYVLFQFMYNSLLLLNKPIKFLSFYM
jgi:hypothetical protein